MKTYVLLSLIFFPGMLHAANSLNPKPDTPDLNYQNENRIADELDHRIKKTANGYKITNASSGTASSDVARYSQIKIIQFVNTSVEASSATTSASYVNANLSKQINISTGSRVFITVTGHIRSSNLSVGAMATIARNGTNLGPANGFCFPVSAGSIVDGLDFPCAMTFTDSTPGVSPTYTVQIKNGGSGTATWCTQGTHAEMTLQEINGQ